MGSLRRQSCGCESAPPEDVPDRHNVPALQDPAMRLIALIETEDTIKKILSAMGLPTEVPALFPARPPPSESPGEGGHWLN